MSAEVPPGVLSIPSARNDDNLQARRQLSPVIWYDTAYANEPTDLFTNTGLLGALLSDSQAL